jgi:carbon monoxide dehydrogenase subunit G
VKLALTNQLTAERGRVFAALVDPNVLQRCIPGCESLTPTGADAYVAVLKIGVAGVKGTYQGTAAVRDKHPPESLTLVFEGKGGPGFVRGSAAIALAAQGDGTAVKCDADVQVGGLIAAVGSRLVEAASKTLANEFFTKLAQELRQTT